MADKLGKPLMPHQRHIVDVATEIDLDTGMFAYDEVVLIGPRQVTGKTEVLLPWMTWRCNGLSESVVDWVHANLGFRPPPIGGPQSVLYAAQSAEEARKKWRNVHRERLLKSPYAIDFTSTLRANHECFYWLNGSTWSPTSGTKRTSGTGDTLDMGVGDEAWSHQDSAMEIGIRPAMSTRHWRQMLWASMIPGPSRVDPSQWRFLKNKRQVGRAKVEADVRNGTCLFDWAAKPGSDPFDPATWWSCMPGLGITVLEKTIREDFERIENLDDLLAEYLGWEPNPKRPRWTLISKEIWAGLCDPYSTIDADAPKALCVEISEDRTQAWIGIAGKRFDGNWHVALAEPGYKIQLGPIGIAWLEPRLLELIEEVKPCTVVVDKRRPASSLVVTLRNRGIDVLTPSIHDVAGACGRFYDATGQDAEPGWDGPMVYHVGQGELDRALAGARKLDLVEGAFTFVRKGTVSAICPLYAVTLAMHGVDVKGIRMPDPDIFV